MKKANCLTTVLDWLTKLHRSQGRRRQTSCAVPTLSFLEKLEIRCLLTTVDVIPNIIAPYECHEIDGHHYELQQTVSAAEPVNFVISGAFNGIDPNATLDDGANFDDCDFPPGSGVAPTTLHTFKDINETYSVQLIREPEFYRPGMEVVINGLTFSNVTFVAFAINVAPDTPDGDFRQYFVHYSDGGVRVANLPVSALDSQFAATAVVGPVETILVNGNEERRVAQVTQLVVDIAGVLPAATANYDAGGFSVFTANSITPDVAHINVSAQFDSDSVGWVITQNIAGTDGEANDVESDTTRILAQTTNGVDIRHVSEDTSTIAGVSAIAFFRDVHSTHNARAAVLAISFDQHAFATDFNLIEAESESAQTGTVRQQGRASGDGPSRSHETLEISSGSNTPNYSVTPIRTGFYILAARYSRDVNSTATGTVLIDGLATSTMSFPTSRNPGDGSGVGWNRFDSSHTIIFLEAGKTYNIALAIAGAGSVEFDTFTTAFVADRQEVDITIPNGATDIRISGNQLIIEQNNVVVTQTTLDGADQLTLRGENDDANSIDLDFSDLTSIALDRVIFDLQAGDDTLNTGAIDSAFGGRFFIFGGDGNDNLDANNAGRHRLRVDAGDGNDTVRTSEGRDTIFGGPGDDEIHAGRRGDTIFSQGGDDAIFGEHGRDKIFAGSGNDYANGGAGADTIFGGDGNDNLRGGAHNDLIHAEAGNDRLRGDRNADTLFGGDGNDTIDGGHGFDVLKGGLGDDTLKGGTHADSLLGEDGNDLLLAGNGSDVALGGEGDDTVFGEGRKDTLAGNNGVDLLPDAQLNEIDESFVLQENWT